VSRRTSILAGLVAAVLAGCGGVAARPAADPSPELSGTLTVLAAASLTEAFTEIGDQLRAEHRGLDVKLSFAGSPTLVTQVQQGAPADVFAAADQANMQKVVAGGFAADPPAVFARNRLEIVVEAGNPRRISSVSDLANPSIKVDVCAPAVPCGSYAAAVFAKAGVRVTPVSQEQDVRSVLTKVGLGEADAGVVYVTDVRSAGGRVQGVEIPDGLNAIAQYPIVRLRSSPNAAAARAFVERVLSARGQRVLEDRRFMPAAP
jgi:molybdate transport system substrate-binding protein